ncbi:MAG: Dabb family protein [Verrucomicrobiales bacterium]
MKRLLCLFGAFILLSMTASADPQSLYRHIVLFKFKDDAPAEAVKKIESEFAALPSKIDTITGFEWGTNLSPENKAQGYTHCFVVTFADQAGLDAYIPHEDHKAFVSLLGPVLDKVLVFDFVPEK